MVMTIIRKTAPDLYFLPDAAHHLILPKCTGKIEYSRNEQARRDPNIAPYDLIPAPDIQETLRAHDMVTRIYMAHIRNGTSNQEVAYNLRFSRGIQYTHGDHAQEPVAVAQLQGQYLVGGSDGQ